MKASMGKGLYQGGGGGEGSYQPAKEDLAQHCLSTCRIGPWSWDVDNESCVKHYTTCYQCDIHKQTSFHYRDYS